MERMCDSSRSGRLVVSLQIVSWCAVGVVLLLRGVTTLRNESSTTTITNCSSESNETSHGVTDKEDLSNSSTTVQKLRKTVNVRINPSSAILITVGTTMLIIGPTLLLARLIDHRRQHQATTRFTKVDAPPSYEEVTEKAPRYSTLFQVTDTGEWVPIPTCEPPHSEPA